MPTKPASALQTIKCSRARAVRRTMRHVTISCGPTKAADFPPALEFRRHNPVKAIRRCSGRANRPRTLRRTSVAGSRNTIPTQQGCARSQSASAGSTSNGDDEHGPLDPGKIHSIQRRREVGCSSANGLLRWLVSWLRAERRRQRYVGSSSHIVRKMRWGSRSRRSPSTDCTAWS